MSVSFLRRRAEASSAANRVDDHRDEVREQLKERLYSLDSKCLEGLVKGLHAASAGDFTIEVDPVTKPIDATSTDPEAAELARVFNSMLGKAQAALEGYNALCSQLRAALGDHSCLGPLTERLHSLSDHCLAGLGDGLRAAAGGDMTVEAVPVTTAVEADMVVRWGSWARCSTRCSARPREGFRHITTCGLRSRR